MHRSLPAALKLRRGKRVHWPCPHSCVQSPVKACAKATGERGSRKPAHGRSLPIQTANPQKRKRRSRDASRERGRGGGGGGGAAAREKLLTLDALRAERVAREEGERARTTQVLSAGRWVAARLRRCARGGGLGRAGD